MVAARARGLIAAAALLALGGCASQGVSVLPPRRTPPANDRGRVVLSFDSIDTVRFGAPVDAVIDHLRGRLGRPDDDTGWVDALSRFGGCPGGQVRAVRWQRLQLLFSDGPTEAGERGSRHFFAYTLSGALDPRPLDARTAEGIGLGATVADVRGAYGDSVTVEAGEEPGTAAARVDGPGERDILLRLTASTPEGRVTSVEAGAPRCGE